MDSQRCSCVGRHFPAPDPTITILQQLVASNARLLQNRKQNRTINVGENGIRAVVPPPPAPRRAGRPAHRLAVEPRWTDRTRVRDHQGSGLVRFFLDVCGNLYLARKNPHTSARRRPGEKKRPPTPRKRSAHVRRPPVPRKKSAHVRRPRPPRKKSAHVPAGRLREKSRKKAHDHKLLASLCEGFVNNPAKKAHVRRQAGRHREKKAHVLEPWSHGAWSGRRAGRGPPELRGIRGAPATPGGAGRGFRGESWRGCGGAAGGTDDGHVLFFRGAARPDDGHVVFSRGC
eukprot:gene7410-biopygen10572